MPLQARSSPPRVTLESDSLFPLCRFFSYGLEKRFRAGLWDEFQALTLEDHAQGSLYGLEKLWAFLHYSGCAEAKAALRQELQELLARFSCIEDFEKARGGKRGTPEKGEASG